MTRSISKGLSLLAIIAIAACSGGQMVPSSGNTFTPNSAVSQSTGLIGRKGSMGHRALIPPSVGDHPVALEAPNGRGHRHQHLSTVFHFTHPLDVANDDNGNIFVSNYTGGSSSGIVKIPSGGTGVPSSILSGVTVNGIAVDSADDVFYTVSGSGGLHEITANGTVKLIGGANQMQTPYGLAVNKAGTQVYVGDLGTNTGLTGLVWVYNYNGSSWTPSKVINTVSGLIPYNPSGWYYPTDMAFDTNGNLFVIDASQGAITELVAGGTQKSLNAMLNTPYNDNIWIGVDPSDNIQLESMHTTQGTTTWDSGILNLTVASGYADGTWTYPGPVWSWYLTATSSSPAAAAPLNDIEGVSVGKSGYMFFADYADGKVIRLYNGGSPTCVGAALMLPNC